MEFFYTALRHLACQDNQQKAPKKGKDAKGSSKDIAADFWNNNRERTYQRISSIESGHIHLDFCCFSRVLERRKAAGLNIFRHGPFFGEIESEYIVSCR